MTKLANKPRKLTVFEFYGPHHSTLEKQLALIRGASTLIKDRTESLMGSADVDPEYVRFINSWSDSVGISGHAVSYEPGKAPRFFNKAGLQKSSISLENSLAELDPEGKKEMVDAVIYFQVFGNIVVLAESRSFNRKDFERHLLVLLQKHQLVKIEETISLRQCVVEDQKAQLHKVKRILVTADLLEKTKVQVANKHRSKLRTKTVRVIKKGTADLLRTLGGDGLANFDITDAEKVGDISVCVEIKIRRPRKDGSTLMTQLSGGLAHVPQENLLLEVDGGVIKGKDLFLSSKVNIKHLGAVVDEIELIQAMRSWFQELSDKKAFG